MLVGEVNNWNNTNFLINNYFEHVEDYNLKGDDLFKGIAI